MKRLALMVGALVLGTALAVPTVSAQVGGRIRVVKSRPDSVKLLAASAWSSAQRSRQPTSAAASLLRRQGYLVPNQAAYERAKAAAAARVEEAPEAVSSSKAVSSNMAAPKIASGDPDIYPAWTGLTDTRATPPDTTGAIGPTRYIELTNLKYSIYDRIGGLLATGGLSGLAGDPLGDLSLSDPQIIWDPGTNRFYYVILSMATNTLDVGFSKTASPSRSSDWCKYFADFGYGSNLPDYPKLGDTRDFWMIGVNVINPGGFFVRSDVDWISKPAAGSTCPSGASFRADVEADLTLHEGSPAFTPVPANQTDTSGTGYVVAAKSPFFPGTNDFIDTIAVTKNPATGDAVFALPVAHSVTAFAFPPNAPQSGTAAVLDTLDARLTNAVSGLDPSKSTTAIWTQHTVASGGGRSEVRWYELGAAVNLRLGTISDGSLYTFNAAISPDRKVSGSTKRFGDAFVVGFNTSSASAFVRIQMVSQWADNVMSQFVEVRASPGFNADFSCNVCRWGDYSGATPDPASNQYSNHGRVWLSNQWNVASANNTDVDWRTYNWGTNPVPYVILNGPTTLFQKGKKFLVSWSLFNQATVADVQYRRAPWNGSFGLPILPPWGDKVPAGSHTFTGTLGNTYCFSAQSYDDIAGPGFRAWGFGPERCALVPLDDRSLAASSGWSRLTGSGYFNNTFSRTTLSGKSLTRTGIHAKSAKIMVTKCPSCGKIKIYWNGTLKHTYNLHSSSTKKKVYLSAVSFSSVHVGTLKIVSSLTSGQKVVVDALAVSAV